MQPITKSQIIAINVAIKKKGLIDDKKKIISDASNGRVTSTKDLHFDEAHSLLMFLNADTDNNQEKIDKQVRKLFAIAYDLKWISERSVIGNGGKLEKKKDFSVLYKWVKSYGYLKKELRDYNEKELPRLITQLQQVAGYYLNK
jgi:hypothetical protein